MIKPSSVFFLILFIIAMLAGCTNPLWYGGGTDRGLTLELELPELPGTDRISRALAFQGKHLYVEIAEILDESVYFDPNQDRNTDDSAFFNLDTGDGVWTATPVAPAQVSVSIPAGYRLRFEGARRDAPSSG